MTIPGFPFVGAGEASYFEWAEMFVCFTRPPSKAEAAAIAERVPPPLRDTIEWKGPILWVASEQGVGRSIKAAYGKARKPPTRPTAQSRFAIAPANANERFNADIDAWLAHAHGKVAIRVAFRREDAEAGGTRLSDWHRASVKQLPELITSLARGAKKTDLAIGELGARLVDAARRYKAKVDPTAARKLAALAEAADEEDDSPDWDALAAVAKKALGKPAPRYTKRRTAEELEPALVRLEKFLPAATKRLRRSAKEGLTVRPGADATALAAVEAALGVELSKEHRALLEAFDGGQIGEIVVLGTARGGAKGDADLVTFTRAWCGEESELTIVAHTGRSRVIALPRGKASPVEILEAEPGWGGGQLTRTCKSLDVALDVALKAGNVPTNG